MILLDEMGTKYTFNHFLYCHWLMLCGQHAKMEITGNTLILTDLRMCHGTLAYAMWAACKNGNYR
jgi:hypothetical protein